MGFGSILGLCRGYNTPERLKVPTLLITRIRVVEGHTRAFLDSFLRLYSTEAKSWYQELPGNPEALEHETQPIVKRSCLLGNLRVARSTDPWLGDG